MKNIFKIEIIKYIKSPIIIGFLIVPILIYFIFLNLLNIPYSLSIIIFIQILFISFFYFGLKIRVYQNQTLIKKINNSKIKKIDYIIPIFIISISTLILTILIPISISIITTKSLGYWSKNQDYIFSNWNNIIGSTNPDSYFQKGIPNDLLLFNSNFLTFMQFIFAVIVVFLTTISISYLLTIFLNNDTIYFSISISLFIIILLISSISKKEILILNSNEYIRSIPEITNKTFIFFKYLNPFFWMNQLIMNVTISDKFSCNYISGASNVLNSPGLFVPSYFNIFYIGTSIGQNSSTIFNRPVFTTNIELFQLLCIIFPLTISTSIITISILK